MPQEQRLATQNKKDSRSLLPTGTQKTHYETEVLNHHISLLSGQEGFLRTSVYLSASNRELFSVDWEEAERLWTED
jgi:hypothetical protein